MGKLFHNANDEVKIDFKLSDLQQIKQFVSIEAMRQCAQKLRQYPLVRQVPPSMIGVFYVLTVLVNSEFRNKQVVLDSCRIVVGLVNKEEFHWLEIGAWYIFADGSDCLETGLVDKTAYTLVSSCSATEFYQKLRRENKPDRSEKKFHT